MIAAIAAVGGPAEVSAAATMARPTPASGNFAAAMAGGLEQLDQTLRAADQAIVRVANGEQVAPHDLMVTLERARFELQFAVEVRNRALEAYQELLRMQV